MDESGVARDDTNDMLKRLPGLLQEYSPTVVIILGNECLPYPLSSLIPSLMFSWNY